MWVNGRHDDQWLSPAFNSDSNVMVGGGISYATGKASRLYLDYMHSFLNEDRDLDKGITYKGPGAQDFPGVKSGQLKLSQQVLSDIYLGKITMWNDKAIAAANPGLKLPAQNITVVHRSDSSGTSFIFTGFLSKASAEWQQKVGKGAAVS